MTTEQSELASDLATGGKLLCKVPLSRLLKIRDLAKAIRVALVLEETVFAREQVREIIEAVNDAIKEAGE